MLSKQCATPEVMRQTGTQGSMQGQRIEHISTMLQEQSGENPVLHNLQKHLPASL